MADALLAHLNARFQAGQPSSNLASAGVLIHQFEYVKHRHGALWEPCPATDPCLRMADRFSSAMISRAAQHMFSKTQPGFVVNESAVRLLCAWAFDANSRERLCNHSLSLEQSEHEHGCIQGCHGKGVNGPPRWCHPSCRNNASGLLTLPRSPCWCSWQPKYLKSALQQQQSWRPLLAYGVSESSFVPLLSNELILDASSWVRNLPYTIEAMFFPADASPRDMELLWKVRAAFLATYRQLNATQVPVFRLNISQSSPFEAVDLPRPERNS